MYDVYQRLSKKADSRYFLRKQENNWVMPGREERAGTRKKKKKKEMEEKGSLCLLAKVF